MISTLAKYAFHQDENFLTETLVYLMNLILEREYKMGLEILAGICGTKVAGWLESAPEIAITTQFTVEEGRPDIVIQVKGNNKSGIIAISRRL